MAAPSPARLCTALHVCVGLASPGTRGGMPASCLQPRLVGRGPRKILLGADPLPKLCSSSGLGTLPHHLPTPPLLSGPRKFRVSRKADVPPVERSRGGDVPFFSPQMYGKWYDVAIGTTCGWMKHYKEKFSMGTLVLGPGPSTDQISATSTRLRYGALPRVLKPPPKPPPPGGLHLPGAGTGQGGCLLWLASEL